MTGFVSTLTGVLAASGVACSAHAQFDAGGRADADNARDVRTNAEFSGPYAPVSEAWPAPGESTSAVASAALSGVYAVADTALDRVEIRGIRREVLWTLERSDLEAMLPWMSLGAGADGPVALAVSDSGLHVFVVVDDDLPSGDGLAGDAIVRLDTTTGEAAVFARIEVGGAQAVGPKPGMAHFEGRLHVATSSGASLVTTFDASGASASGTSRGQSVVFGAGVLRGLAVDRETGTLLAADGTRVYRAEASNTPVFSAMTGTTQNVRGIAWSDHFGGPELGGESLGGLFVLTDSGSGAGDGADEGAVRIRHAPSALARAGVLGTLPVYAKLPGGARGISATACGGLLIGRSGSASIVRDARDPSLPFEEWLIDEFSQVMTYGRGLISPDGEPAGWVIDADATAGAARFHPATPDAAGWVTLLLLVSDDVLGDAGAQADVRTILRRYAGLAADGIGPGYSADGMVRHWCDPFSASGQAKAGWPDEFATFSTMLMTMGAARARAYYPDDVAIQAAANEIISKVTDWDAYIQPGTDATFLKSLGTQPDPGSALAPYHEGILFVDQARTYDPGPTAEASYARWLDRSNWPSATLLPGRPIAGNAPGSVQSAFTSLYPLLVTRAYRDSQDWQAQVRDLYASHAAWTDDNGARWFTVFSAGTTKPAFGGYNADSLTDHPGDFATFPSLMAFSADGSTEPAAAAYHAYRRGQRQTWSTGASMLYRRSNPDPGYRPNTAGVPDVALGALGLAELIRAGFVDEVLAPATLAAAPLSGSVPMDVYIGYWLAGDPRADVDRDGDVGLSDLRRWLRDR